MVNFRDRALPTTSLRFPASLKAALDRAALANGCSFSREVMSRLEASLRYDPAPPAPVEDVGPLASETAKKALAKTEEHARRLDDHAARLDAHEKQLKELKQQLELKL